MEIVKGGYRDDSGHLWNSVSSTGLVVMDNSILDTQSKKQRYFGAKDEFKEIINGILKLVDENETKKETREKRSKNVPE